MAQGLLVAGVTEDERLPAVRAGAVAWAEAFGMKIRLVRAMDVHAALPLDTRPGYTSQAVTEWVLESELSRVEAWLEGEQKHWRCPSGLSWSVHMGPAAQAVIADAVVNRANLIVVGSSPADYGKTIRGLSTALTLMHEAPLPVLVLGNDKTAAIGHPGYRILLADDLRPATEAAVQAAYALAARLHGATLLHVHVAEGPATRPSPASTVAMGARAAPFDRAAREAGTTVTFEVRHGEAPEQLRAVETEFRPDLVVFGRHRTLHLRPSLIGRMPLLAMMRTQAAILLVPPANEQYGPLPFPSRSDKPQGN